MTNKTHTPGPWSWMISNGGNPYLATSDRGCLYVMGFSRRGMQGATPMFAHWEGIEDGKDRGRFGGIMMDIQDFTDRFGSHPDALVIEAAPELLEALIHLVQLIEVTFPKQQEVWLAEARAAIAKAKGEG